MSKTLAKEAVNTAAVVLVSPLIILFWTGRYFMDENGLIAGFSQMLSLIPGKSGSYLRKSFLRFAMTHCHNECVISFGTLFSQVDTEIEQGVFIGAQCNIGKCRIEKNCLIGSGVHILSGKKQHNFSDISTPIQAQGGIFEKIVIGEDVWIGNGALLMANVGRKCIIGAGSVITEDVPDYSIMAGNPARIIKKRAA